MIRTSTQLKAKVRNLSEGDNNRAIIRRPATESAEMDTEFSPYF